MPERQTPPAAAWAAGYRWLAACWAAGALALFAATWRLWTPQTGFPQVPLWGGGWPDWLEWTLFAGLWAGAAGWLTLAGRWQRLAAVVLAVCVAALIVGDQHRLQPWAYQLLLTLLVWIGLPPAAGIGWLRWLTISIYAYSALGKLDYQFLHTLGQQFLGVPAGWLSLDPSRWAPRFRLAAATAFPLIELAIAVALSFVRVRKAAVVAAIALHVALLAILGPAGLDQRPGVLLWNLVFAAQTWILFASYSAPAASSESGPRAAPQSAAGWLAASAVLIALIGPLAEPWGRWDHWLAWGLYSPRSSRCQVWVRSDVAGQLPEDCQRHLSPEQGGQGDGGLGLWRRLRMDRWSLAALDAPIYPQARFQLGAAWAVSRWLPQRSLRVVWQEASSRWDGRRRQRILHGPEQYSAAANQQWLNARPAIRSSRR